MDVQTRDLRNPAIAAAPQAHGLHAGVQPALMFIERTEEEQQRRLRLIGERGSRPGSRCRGDGLPALDELRPAYLRVDRTVQVAGNLLAHHTTAASQQAQSVLRAHGECAVQFCDVIARRRLVHPMGRRIQQRAKLGEARGTHPEQPVFVKLRQLLEGVELSAVGVAAEIPEGA